ncbi:MAG: hypothetical protein JJT90_10870 [Ectothiorhodospiraceae bacterium]|nr:hypothetical protein [Ectothiorhodospiraceae bacterium]
MENKHSSDWLRPVLLLDAGACVAMGLVLLLIAGFLHTLTGIPAALLYAVGLALFPIAAFIAWVASRKTDKRLVMLVVAGNTLWVAGSLWLMFGGPISPTAWGYAFIGAQALAVAAFAVLEFVGGHPALGRSLRKRPGRVASG